MKDVKEQKQNDNGEIIEMKQGQVIKIPKNGGKAWLTLFSAAGVCQQTSCLSELTTLPL